MNLKMRANQNQWIHYSHCSVLTSCRTWSLRASNMVRTTQWTRRTRPTNWNNQSTKECVKKNIFLAWYETETAWNSHNVDWSSKVNCPSEGDAAVPTHLATPTRINTPFFNLAFFGKRNCSLTQCNFLFSCCETKISQSNWIIPACWKEDPSVKRPYIFYSTFPSLSLLEGD